MTEKMEVLFSNCCSWVFDWSGQPPSGMCPDCGRNRIWRPATKDDYFNLIGRIGGEPDWFPAEVKVYLLNSIAEGPKLEQYSGAIRLFRYWKLTSTNRLKAIVYDYQWEKKNCAPFMGRSGGFYGWNDLCHAQNDQPLWDNWRSNSTQHLRYSTSAKAMRYILGSFLGYGRFAVHSKGGRCEYAVPEYLIEPENFDLATRLISVAEDYGLKIISLEQAQTLRTGLVPWVKPWSKEEGKDAD